MFAAPADGVTHTPNSRDCRPSFKVRNRQGRCIGTPRTPANDRRHKEGKHDPSLKDSELDRLTCPARQAVIGPNWRRWSRGRSVLRLSFGATWLFGFLRCRPAQNMGMETVLPEGSAPAPIAVQHFPDRIHEFVWRNWTVVEPARLAAILGTSAEQVRALATSMGLLRRLRLQVTRFLESEIVFGPPTLRAHAGRFADRL